MLNNQQLLSMETASKPRFTFNSAFELVQSMELEDQNLKELQDPGSRKVNKFSTHGRTGHQSSQSSTGLLIDIG